MSEHDLLIALADPDDKHNFEGGGNVKLKLWIYIIKF